MRRIGAERVDAPIAYHGEGPIWDADAGMVRWVDVLAGDVLSTSASGGTATRLHVGDVAACVVPRTSGGLAVATERGFALVEPDDSIVHLPEVWSDPTVRMNDGACDRSGRFFCGSMAYDDAPGRGALYRLDPDLTVTQVMGDVTISNGLGWSPDGTSAYYIDTPTRRVDELAYDEARGQLSHRRCAIDLAEFDGVPDGIAVDAEGGIWVALWGGGQIHRYLEGTLEAVVEVPVAQVSSCAFGGRDLDQLFITTSAKGLAAPEPGAGALHVADPGVPGTPTAAFAA